MTTRCERQDCKDTNRCQAPKPEECPAYPGPPTYPEPEEDATEIFTWKRLKDL